MEPTSSSAALLLFAAVGFLGVAASTAKIHYGDFDSYYDEHCGGVVPRQHKIASESASSYAVLLQFYGGFFSADGGRRRGAESGHDLKRAVSFTPMAMHGTESKDVISLHGALEFADPNVSAIFGKSKNRRLREFHVRGPRIPVRRGTVKFRLNGYWSQSSAVPVKRDNLSQFRQPELPHAEPAWAWAPASVTPSSQGPKQAQAFDPSLSVPVRRDDLSKFRQSELPLAEPAPALTPPSSQAPIQAPVFDPSLCAPEIVMYKNWLQDYALKMMVHLPIYETRNEGSQHAPRYRSTVFIDGKSFTSPNTFSRKKEAEQNVAKIALDLCSLKMEDEGSPLIPEDAIFCKSILNEFAKKMNLEMPNYTTVQLRGAVPVFVSSLVFNGVIYTGDVGKSKREAELLVARAAIQSLYDDSNSTIVLSKIIKSKWKLLPAYRETEYSCPIGVNVGAIPEACSEVPTRHQLFQIPRAVAEASSSVGNPLISFVPSSVEQQPSAATSSGKKRRKNKKKAIRKQCVDPQEPTARPTAGE